MWAKKPITLDFEDDGASFRVRRERQLRAMTPMEAAKTFVNTIVWCITGFFVIAVGGWGLMMLFGVH